MKNLLEKIKIFYLLKFDFSIPPKKKILIIDEENVEFLKKFISKKKFNSVNIRNKKYNFFIILKMIFSFKFSFHRYLVEYIKFTKSKIVITFNDNNINFYKLKKYFGESKNFVSIQNGIRTEFGDLFGIAKEQKLKNLASDYILVFGNKIGLNYKKIIKTKTITIGSLKNNCFKNVKKVNKKNLLYISSFNEKHFKQLNNRSDKIYQSRGKKKFQYYDIFNTDFELPNQLSIYCKSNNLNFSICGRTNNKMEKKFYDKIIDNQYKFIYRNDLSRTYKEILKNFIIVGGPSTCLLEALSRKKRVAIFNVKLSNFERSYNFAWPKKISKKGFFYSNETTFKEVNRVLNNTRNVNTKKYTKIIKPFKSLMIFDNNNKKFKSFLKKILN